MNSRFRCTPGCNDRIEEDGDGGGGGVGVGGLPRALEGEVVVVFYGLQGEGFAEEAEVVDRYGRREEVVNRFGLSVSG
jgi:hypothetical protein